MTETELAAQWNRRYRRGGTSGPGSEGEAAQEKADYLYAFVDKHDVKSVIDWGVGDGEVLSRWMPKIQYTGIDVADFIVRRLQQQFYADNENMAFATLQAARAMQQRAELALSLDVIFHQVAFADFLDHLNDLFTSAQRYVIIHAPDIERGQTARHVRWREFSPYIAEVKPEWKRIERPEPRDVTGFHVYEKMT